MAALLLLVGALAVPVWGPHPVGFEVMQLEDASRPLGGRPRPIQLSFWYPAQPTARATLVFRDYVALAASERGPAAIGAEDAAIAKHAAFLHDAAKLPPADVARWLDRRMRAVAHGKALAGPWPLVLVAQGNDNGAEDQATLCELLASQGFVVATSPSPTRIAGPMKNESDIARVAEDQALDLAAIQKAVRARTSSRHTRPAVVAHSFGARSALLFAMRDGASALVSLDGGIGTNRGQSELMASRFYDSARATFPILHVYEDLDSFMAPDFSLLRSLTGADRWFVRSAHLHHVHFTEIGAALAGFPALAIATGADPDTAAAYDDVARTTVALLEAVVSGDREHSAARADRALNGGARNLGVVAKLPAVRR
jgi:dienelactone hydrolase